MSVLLKKITVPEPKLSISVPALGILLVEDNHQDAYLIRKTLNQIGNVYWEEDVDSGLHEALQEKLDLILLSMNLQGIPSMEPFQQFLKQNPEIPIILLCDAETKLLGELATQHGAMAILDKNMFENSDYLIKMITSFMIKAKFMKNSEKAPETPESDPNSSD